MNQPFQYPLASRNGLSSEASSQSVGRFFRGNAPQEYHTRRYLDPLLLALALVLAGCGDDQGLVETIAIHSPLDGSVLSGGTADVVVFVWVTCQDPSELAIALDVNEVEVESIDITLSSRLGEVVFADVDLTPFAGAGDPVVLQARLLSADLEMDRSPAVTVTFSE